MYLVDYHMHSNNSFDSKETVASVCEAAIVKGIKEICFTEHFSVKEGLKSHGFLNLKKYSDEIAECRRRFKDELIIRVGLEICEPHENEEELNAIIENLPLDFVLGSIHNINFNTGLITYMSQNDKHESYRRYFEEVNKVCTSPYIDIVAHLDLMKRYAFNTHGRYEFNEYKELIEDVLKNIIKSGKGIEVNTSTLRSIVNETMPGEDILRLYYDLGGRIITVGSDAHKCEDVGAGIEESISMLKAIGFNEIYTFENRQAIAIEI
ncbi:histidinol-phosphatase HisJ family protein [Clostridium celatum]|uniref:histidinol-phosphatase HisJ family protein n=1 Tax=Clostridium celatum TaxID=36834 RepID=UPI00319DE11E